MVTVPLGSSGTAGRAEVVGTGTTPTVAEPAAAKNGDVLFSFAVSDVAGAITPPAGWTTLFTGVGTVAVFTAAWIRRGEVAPSLTWSLTGSVNREVYVVCLEPSDQIITLNGISVSGAQTASSNVPPNPPPVTMVAPTGLAVCCGYNYGSISTWTCAGYTLRTSGTSGNDGGVFTKSLSAAGIEDPPAWGPTGGGSNNLWDGSTVIFTDIFQVTPSYTSSPPVIVKRLVKQHLLGDD